MFAGAPRLGIFGFSNTDRSVLSLPLTPRVVGLSAVSKCSQSCRSASLTGTAIPPPKHDASSWGRLSPTFRYCAVLRLLLGHWPPSFGPRAYRSRGTQQISLGKTERLRTYPVANTSRHQRLLLGFVARGRLTPPSTPYGASLSLETDAHLRLPSDSPSRVTNFALRSPHISLAVGSNDPGAPGQRPCLLGVGFPPSGPRVRTCRLHNSPPVFQSCQSHLRNAPASGGRVPHTLPVHNLPPS